MIAGELMKELHISRCLYALGDVGRKMPPNVMFLVLPSASAQSVLSI